MDLEIRGPGKKRRTLTAYAECNILRTARRDNQYGATVPPPTGSVVDALSVHGLEGVIRGSPL